MNPETTTFTNQIKDLTETDYGDFMRSAYDLLLKLRDDVSYYADPDIQKRIENMKTYLQFNPNWEIESTRNKLLADAVEIDELIKNHQDNWDILNDGPKNDFN